MSRTIVIPLLGPTRDPERVSEAVLPVARALAQRTQATVVLVSVLEALPDFGDLPFEALDRPEVVAGRVAALQEYLARDVAATFPESRPQVIVTVGDPVTEILGLTNLFDQPVIALASHGRSGVHRLVLGSVAFQLVQRAPCPVLVVPAMSPREGQPAPRTIERVLVPLDGSPRAEHALDRALAVLGPATLDVHLLMAVSQRRRRAPSAAPFTRRGAERYLAEVAERLVLRGHRAAWEVCIGSPAEAVERVVRRRAIDLIAMATHGRGGIGRLLHGSVAEDIAQRQVVPLLLVRPSAAEIDASLRAARAGYRVGPPTPPAPPAPVATVFAADVMTTPVVTAREDATLEELARLMLAHGIGCVPIVDDAGRLVGIVTESDFVAKERGVPFSAYRTPQLFGQWLSHEGVEQIYALGRTLTARQVMRAPVITAREDDPITDVMERLVRYDIARIPVVSDGVPVGIIARHDLLKLLASTPDSG